MVPMNDIIVKAQSFFTKSSPTHSFEYTINQSNFTSGHQNTTKKIKENVGHLKAVKHAHSLFSFLDIWLILDLVKAVCWDVLDLLDKPKRT